MGETLSREFSLSPVNTGRQSAPTPAQLTSVAPANGIAATAGAPGAPVMRPSFLTSFLSNLGPALQGGLAITGPHMERGGLSGALGEIRNQQLQNRQLGMQEQANERQNQLAQSQIAAQGAQTSRTQQLTPLEVQQQQFNVQQRQGLLNLANNPEQLANLFNSATPGLANMTPEETAMLDSAKAATVANLRQGKFDLSPYNQAVEKVATNRMQSARKTIGPPKVQYDQGIPVAVQDKDGTVYDANDPNIPAALKPLLASAQAAHAKSVQERAEVQGRVFTQQLKMLDARDQLLSSSTKTMREAAPKVLELAQRVRDEMSQQVSSLGPLAGRWNEFMTGKVGAPNKQFAQLRTDVGLLQTLLMRMHVGARGGGEIMQHFESLINAGSQSPETMAGALNSIESYAHDVLSETKTPPAQGKPSGKTKGKGDPLGIF